MVLIAGHVTLLLSQGSGPSLLHVISLLHISCFEASYRSSAPLTRNGDCLHHTELLS
jgi:hypothetical protein